MNTLVGYMYRDAANYKFYYQEVVEGEITKEQVEAVFACLEEGIYFIPEEVGLPCEYAKGCVYDEDLDHPWCELFTGCFVHTGQVPTIDMKVDDLVLAFERAKGNWEGGNEK